MDLKVQLKTLDLIVKIINGSMDRINLVEYAPQKVVFDRESPYEQAFLRATPESVGISSRYLSRFLKDVSKDPLINMHGIMILKDGRVISEAAFAPFQKDLWHITHSMCKSITGLAVGLAVEEGFLSLDEKLVDIFRKKTNVISMVRLKNLTLEHLLKMSRGIIFNETGAVTENDWIKAYMESGISFEPGAEFAYNSMNTFMLSAIIKEKTGMGLMDYLKPRLWEPLGIRRVYWELNPRGIEKGGWGLSLCLEDMAKIGQLYLQKGMWNGVQLIPAWWIEESVTKKMDMPENMGNGYGYQIWMGKRPGSFQCNGMLGQNIIVYPDLNMVIVNTAGNNELFQTSRMMDVIGSYFETEKFHPDKALAEDAGAYRELQYVQEHLKCSVPYEGALNQHGYLGGWPGKKEKVKRRRTRPDKAARPEADAIRQLAGRKYVLEKNAAGILPIFLQCFHNNYAKGLVSLEFAKEQDGLLIRMREGDSDFTVPIGFGSPAYGRLNINGEPYEIGTVGEYTADEDGTAVLKTELSFIETSNTRTIKFFFTEDGVRMVLDEIPGLNLIVEGVSSVIGKVGAAIVDVDYSQYKVKKALVPEIKGVMERR